MVGIWVANSINSGYSDYSHYRPPSPPDLVSFLIFAIFSRSPPFLAKLSCNTLMYLCSCVGFAIRHIRVLAFVMRKQNNLKRITALGQRAKGLKSLYSRCLDCCSGNELKVTAWHGELKVANPDNIEKRKRFIVKAMFINFFSALKKFVQNYSLR